MKNILIFLMLGILFSCTNLNKQDKLLTLEGECSQAGNISKQCEIINLKGLTITEKENLMGWVYLNGTEKIEPDFDKAYYWLEKAAKLQNSEALNSLGIIYLYGLGKQKDLDIAEEYFKQADKLGDKNAKNNLGELYRIKNKNSSAEHWFNLAIKDNPYKAYEGLSKMYIEQEKFKEAYEYSEKAAELNNPEAEYNLGVFYEQGIYVKKDIKRAMYWYEKAAKQGHINAINNLNLIKS